MKIRTLFCGTSYFAVPILEEILKLDFLDVVGLVTQPDRPVGRKKILTPPQTKALLLEKGIDIPVFQPEKLKPASEEILKKTEPELILVASYGQFIPSNMLNFPKYKCLNYHGSVLPKLRGAVPIPMSIVHGFEKTGVTVQIMEKGMDTGDVICSAEVDMEINETTTSLTQKLSRLSAEVSKECLSKWVNGEITPVPQNKAEVTFCYQKDIAKANAELNGEEDASVVERMVRAFTPWPNVWFVLGENMGVDEKYIGKRLKILNSEVVFEDFRDNRANFSLFLKNGELMLVLGDKALKLTEIQLEGKKVDKGYNFSYILN